MEIEIRKEREEDFGEVFRIVEAAFEQENEARLVEKLRKIPHISLVAVFENKISGHILFSPVSLEGDSESNFWGLAPLSVAPEFQNRGIGSALSKAGLERCKEECIEAVFVLGHPNYYPRFGFEVAAKRGFRSEYPVPDEHFMVTELKEGALEGRNGLVKYAPEFSTS